MAELGDTDVSAKSGGKCFKHGGGSRFQVDGCD